MGTGQIPTYKQTILPVQPRALSKLNGENGLLG